MKLALFVMLLISAKFSFANPGCGGSLLKGKYSINHEKITLPAYDYSNSFFILAGASQPHFHYAITMKPEDLIDELKNRLPPNGHGSKATGALLQELEKDLPLKDNTDLFKYGLKNTALLAELNSIAITLLSKQKASLLDLWEIDKKDVQVKGFTLAKLEQRGSKFRIACNNSNELFLSVTDSIAD